MTIFAIELAYQQDSSHYFNALADLPWAVYLDSCHPYTHQGRYDIMSARPEITLETNGKITTITRDGESYTSEDNPFTLLKEYLPKKQQSQKQPFCGGVIGYLGYELAHHLENLPEKNPQMIVMPDLAVGIYDWAIVTDHQLQQTHLVSAKLFPQTERTIQQVLDHLASPVATKNDFKLSSPFSANTNRQEYQQAFQKIKQYINDGHCYQINLSTCFSASFSGSPWSAYRTLRQHNPAPYAAFMNLPQGQLLSLSPERFLQVKDKHVETKPIKGTSPRSDDPDIDQHNARQLMNSRKDKAENLMIVDLLRNDLGKSCALGSIAVPQLFALESFPAVHHLVSTVTGKLAEDKHSIDLLHDCFPGGSITGAPKIRAMEIISELETQQRNIYCGSIIYIDYNGDMDSNIAIRTLVCDGQKIHCAAGGGIVADSDCHAEYQEIHDKIGLIIKTLEATAD